MWILILQIVVAAVGGSRAPQQTHIHSCPSLGGLPAGGTRDRDGDRTRTHQTRDDSLVMMSMASGGSCVQLGSLVPLGPLSMSAGILKHATSNLFLFAAKLPPKGPGEPPQTFSTEARLRPPPTRNTCCWVRVKTRPSSAAIGAERRPSKSGPRPPRIDVRTATFGAAFCFFAGGSRSGGPPRVAPSSSCGVYRGLHSHHTRHLVTLATRHCGAVSSREAFAAKIFFASRAACFSPAPLPL